MPQQGVEGHASLLPLLVKGATLAALSIGGWRCIDAADAVIACGPGPSRAAGTCYFRRVCTSNADSCGGVGNPPLMPRWKPGNSVPSRKRSQLCFES
jgi:hypothetical protein